MIKNTSLHFINIKFYILLISKICYNISPLLYFFIFKKLSDIVSPIGGEIIIFYLVILIICSIISFDYIRECRKDQIESNEQRTPIWFIPYNATDLFGVTSLNDVKSVAKFKISPEYIQHKYTDVPGSEDRGKDEGTRTNEQCNFDNDNMEGVFNCKGYSILSSGYLYYMFNKLSFQWTK